MIGGAGATVAVEIGDVDGDFDDEAIDVPEEDEEVGGSLHSIQKQNWPTGQSTRPFGHDTSHDDAWS